MSNEDGLWRKNFYGGSGGIGGDRNNEFTLNVSYGGNGGIGAPSGITEPIQYKDIYGNWIYSKGFCGTPSRAGYSGSGGRGGTGTENQSKYYGKRGTSGTKIDNAVYSNGTIIDGQPYTIIQYNGKEYYFIPYIYFNIIPWQSDKFLILYLGNMFNHAGIV